MQQMLAKTSDVGMVLVSKHHSRPLLKVFRLDALALSVIATATCLAGWLAGWLGGWLSHSGIVSKRLNLSEKFFDYLKAPSP